MLNDAGITGRWMCCLHLSVWVLEQGAGGPPDPPYTPSGYSWDPDPSPIPFQLGQGTSLASRGSANESGDEAVVRSG